MPHLLAALADPAAGPAAADTAAATYGLVMVAVAGFFAFIVSYLSNWLWRIKGEKGALHSRLQFDKEFEIHQRLWAALARLQFAAQACAAGHGDSTRLAADRDAALAAARDAVHEYSPFYTESIFTAAQAALASARQVQPGAEGQAALDRLDRELTGLRQAIRARFAVEP